MRITASQFRKNVYRILDDVIASRMPVEVVRNGAVLRITPETQPSKLDRLRNRSAFKGDPDDIIGLDWSHYTGESC